MTVVVIHWVVDATQAHVRSSDDGLQGKREGGIARHTDLTDAAPKLLVQSVRNQMSQLPDQNFPSDRPVNGAFQWLALLGVTLTLVTVIRLLW
jgi:hypothetical protein